MEGTDAPANTDQSGVVIQRTEDGLPVYFCPRVARDYAGGSGGWVQQPEKALRFARPIDADEFAKFYLAALAPYCRAVPIALAIDPMRGPA